MGVLRFVGATRWHGTPEINCSTNEASIFYVWHMTVSVPCFLIILRGEDGATSASQRVSYPL